jgi:RNA polymerase sigma factor for flagellar operon FliA
MSERTPTIPQKVEQKLWTKYVRTRSSAVENEIVRLYQPFVAGEAEALCRRLPKLVRRDDLIAYGTAGLLDSIRKFDPTAGVKFATFARRRIFGEMIDGLRELAPHTRAIMTRLRDIDAAENKLLGQLGRQPTHEEIRKAVGLDKKRFAHAMECRPCLVNQSLNERFVSWEGQYEFGDMLADPRVHEPGAAMDAATIFTWTLNNRKLTDAIIIGFYFLQGLTQREIGKFLGMTESRISQKVRDIVRILRAEFTRGDL